jgi:hypothetical protein
MGAAEPRNLEKSWAPLLEHIPKVGGILKVSVDKIRVHHNETLLGVEIP